MKPTYRIENWCIVLDKSPYMAPEMEGLVKLSGKIYGHPTIEDGVNVKTSELVAIDTGQMIAETMSSFYQLGAQDTNWTKYLEENGYTLAQYSKYLKLAEILKRKEEKTIKEMNERRFFDDNFSMN